ncbi:Early nodulin-like protein 1 [Rhynchospora pubera]|uniref:Early nodulin-like protein 1 n=1 Tax=Rhynchospora pubera TaxID=906938 RepID=A0AAV8DPW8_9POAL|nr:Early nodulin-like protein 1 [Rhynchospora pubera]
MKTVHVMIVAIVVCYIIGACNGHEEFHVGGAEGWRPHPSESFNQWAQKHRFHISDRLVFEHKDDKDSVLVVKKQHYDTCDNSNPYLKLIGGKSIFDFGRSGEYFFISENHEQCEAGEKMVVAVMADRAPSPPLPARPPPSHFPKGDSSDTAPVSRPLPHNSSSASSSSNNRVLASMVYLVLTVGIIFRA